MVAAVGIVGVRCGTVVGVAPVAPVAGAAAAVQSVEVVESVVAPHANDVPASVPGPVVACARDAVAAASTFSRREHMLAAALASHAPSGSLVDVVVPVGAERMCFAVPGIPAVDVVEAVPELVAVPEPGYVVPVHGAASAVVIPSSSAKGCLFNGDVPDQVNWEKRLKKQTMQAYDFKVSARFLPLGDSKISKFLLEETRHCWCIPDGMQRKRQKTTASDGLHRDQSHGHISKALGLFYKC